MLVFTSDLYIQYMFQQQIETICVNFVVTECSKYGIDELICVGINIGIHISVIGISVIWHIGASL